MKYQIEFTVVLNCSNKDVAAHFAEMLEEFVEENFTAHVIASTAVKLVRPAVSEEDSP